MTAAAISDLRTLPVAQLRDLDPVAAGARHQVRLLGEPRDVSVARGFIRHVLARSATPDRVDNVALVVSELVTAAVLSGSGPITLEIVAHQERALVYVTTVRRPCPPPQPRERLRPDWMRVVDRLTTDWWTET